MHWSTKTLKVCAHSPEVLEALEDEVIRQLMVRDPACVQVFPLPSSWYAAAASLHMCVCALRGATTALERGGKS